MWILVPEIYENSDKVEYTVFTVYMIDFKNLNK